MRQKAIEDLTDIWDYSTHKWSKNQANKYFGMIKTACGEITQNSIIGKNYDKIDNKIRGHRVGKHIVFYQIFPNEEIEVIRILHESMDLQNRLT